MIIFKSVEWSNFLSTGNIPNKLILNESSSVLIVGSNGEGKSTMLDALCFGLFGKPFRNINKNQLINSINGKKCIVEILFSVNNKEYKIIRGIKPNIFEIWVNDELINKDAALKDYQKILEQQILKLNYKTFTQVVILGSSSFIPFMQLPTGQRREVIEDILDIRIFTVMNQILKQKVSNTKDEIIKIESEISSQKVKIDSQKKLIDSLVSAKEDVLLNLNKKIETNLNSISDMQELINQKTNSINELKSTIIDEKDISDNIEKAKTIKITLSNKMDTCNHNVEFFNKNEICPSCSQSISHSHKKKVLEDLEHKIKEHRLKLQMLDTGMDKLNNRLKSILEISESITDLSIEISTLSNNIRFLNTQNQDLSKEIESTKKEGGNIEEEKNIMKTIAEEAMVKLKYKTELIEEKKLQEIAVTLLKDTGIKTAIIKEYLPAMNKLINRYLNTMDFYVSFELDESFNETIKSRHRDEFTYESFSEGEKMRIDLAILFTWRQIAKMKNSVNTNLLILDEIFDSSLDVTGTDYFLSIMNSFGDKTNVFVISHKGDQLLDKFQTVIKFEKRNEFSIISTL